MFSPTPRQEAFRALVSRLRLEDDDAQQEADERWAEHPIGDQPKVRRRWRLQDWCRESALAGERVTAAEYLTWEQDEGFLPWWWSTQAEFSPITLAEQMYADRRFFEAVVDNIENPAMARVYGALKAVRADDDDGVSTEMRELLEHLTAAREANPYLIVGVVGEAK